MGGFFFRERFWGNFCNMVNIFTCRCPNSGVGAIDSPDLFEHVLDQRYIPKVSEKISRAIVLTITFTKGNLR